MLLDNLTVVLVKTRFPENIGMAARACANMGCPNLRLADPEMWDLAKAAPLATGKGEDVLRKIGVYGTLADALADQHFAWGATARLGGWRKAPSSPWQAAAQIASEPALKTALVFGPEDKGLANAEIAQCGALIHISTHCESSLNLAQAVLVVLYECAKMADPRLKKAPQTPALATVAELSLLESRLRASLARLHCANETGDYYFLAWSRLLARAKVRKHEYDILMGFCRQLDIFCKSASGR